MTQRIFLGLGNFLDACSRAECLGFDVRDARYDGVNFGYWSVEISRKGMRPRTILWEARDYWVIVQSAGANGESQEELVIKAPTVETVAEILSRLAENGALTESG